MTFFLTAEKVPLRPVYQASGASNVLGGTHCTSSQAHSYSLWRGERETEVYPRSKNSSTVGELPRGPQMQRVSMDMLD